MGAEAAGASARLYIRDFILDSIDLTGGNESAKPSQRYPE
jgi:hypothetical protein